MNQALIERLVTAVVGAGIIAAGALLKLPALDGIGLLIVGIAIPHPATRLPPPGPNFDDVPGPVPTSEMPTPAETPSSKAKKLP